MNYICVYVIYRICMYLMLTFYGFPHRSLKWWKKVFFHLLDLTIVNSHILYREATGSRMTQLDNRLAVARSRYK